MADVYFGGQALYDSGDTNPDLTSNPTFITWTNNLGIALNVYAQLQIGKTAALASTADTLTVTIDIDGLKSIVTIAKESQTKMVEQTRSLTVPPGSTLTINVDATVAGSPTCRGYLYEDGTHLPAGAILFLTTGAGTTTTVVCNGGLSANDDTYIGRRVIALDGDAAGEATDVTDYTGSTGTLTVTATTVAVGSGATVKLV